jgi:hypothetical protein
MHIVFTGSWVNIRPTSVVILCCGISLKYVFLKSSKCTMFSDTGGKYLGLGKLF